MAVIAVLIRSPKAAGVIGLAAQVALLAAALVLIIFTHDQPVITVIGGYEGYLGIILLADTTTAAFILLTAFIFLAATIYAFIEKLSNVYWFFLLIWEAMLIGIFLSNDMFNIFVLLEVSTVIVTSLIMYNRHFRSMYDGLFFLMVNIVGVLFYLFGLGYIYRLIGVFDMTAGAAMIQELSREQLYLPYALIMTFLALKCAIVPMFSWLPKVYGTPGAPPFVLAILSGINIKASLFLFIRFQAMFGETLSAAPFFIAVGIITALFGIVKALSKRDMYLILAYSSVAQMGLIVVALNLQGPYSHIGSLYHMINHAILKSALFLSAGVIASAYGTRDIAEIRGIFKQMPIVATATIVVILGMVGAPLFNGSISKYLLTSGVSWPLFSTVAIINLGTVVMFFKYTSIFLGKSAIPRPRIDKWKQATLVGLGILCVLGGVLGRQAVYVLFGTEITVDTAGYLIKVGIFAGSCVIGYFAWMYIKTHTPLLERIQRFDMGFRSTVASIGVFFAMILIAVSLL